MDKCQSCWAYTDQFTAIFVRFFISTLAFIIIFPLLKINFSIKRLSIKTIMICSGILVLYNYCFFTGTMYGLAGAGGVLVTTTNPIITMAIIALLDRRPLKYCEVLGIVFGILGGCFIINIWQYGLGESKRQYIFYFLFHNLGCINNLYFTNRQS